MPLDEQIELIDAHPRLGAPPAAVSRRCRASSRATTARARNRGDAEPTVAAELDRLNAAYEARFGFRYCVFVAGRSRAALLPEMAGRARARTATPRSHRALDAVVDIAARSLCDADPAATEAAS